jgi:hypothetical protein
MYVGYEIGTRYTRFLRARWRGWPEAEDQEKIAEEQEESVGQA